MKDYSLNEEARVIEEFTCECCKKTVDGYAAIDPIEIEGRLFCDECGSNYSLLRNEMLIETASEKTKKLVKAVDDANHQLAWQQMCDKFGRVKHI